METEMKWIHTSEKLPEDQQPVAYLTAGGYSGTEVFYQAFFDMQYSDADSCDIFGPAGHWGSGKVERLYWFPLPSFYNVPGVTLENDCYIQRELSANAEGGDNNDNAA